MRGVAREVSEPAKFKDIEGATIDIWLVLEPVETISLRGEPMQSIGGDTNVFWAHSHCHTGYFEQYYWSTDEYPMFIQEKMEVNEVVII